jgi:isoprenylcysteine carboxyl methyltransferase (ICMT) family protein YpbQ
MPAIPPIEYNAVIFVALASIKGLVELYALSRKRKGEETYGKGTSLAFIVLGSLAPLAIACEVFLAGHILPGAVCFGSAAACIALWMLRAYSVASLGRFYSVDICVFDGHALVKEGIYRYLRHPIYLIALLESVFYPLAAGAYVSCILLVLTGTPAVLIRRHTEERVLLRTFGREYEEYRKSTLF